MYIEDIKEDNLWLMKGDCLERMQEIAELTELLGEIEDDGDID